MDHTCVKYPHKFCASCFVQDLTTSDGITLCQCQGCGMYADISKLGEAHNCYRTEDGSYEEGGTFQ